MHITVRHIALLYCLALLTFTSKAQDGIVQLRFSATEVSGKVFLDWTMDLGQTCNGIDITRSTDNLSFSIIGDIQGICGSPTDTVSYSFIDESPIPNQINYYRLTLGNLGPTQTLSVEIINLEGTGFQVRPNPIIDQGRIYFDNDRNEEHLLTLYSIFGKEVLQSNSRTDFFEVDRSPLADGTYVFRIEDSAGNARASGKLVVAD